MKLFPFDAGLNKKWWHRFSKVLIFGISLMAILIGILISYAGISESEIRYEIYDFEKGYHSHGGNVISANRYSVSYDFIDRLVSASNEVQSTEDGRERLFRKAIDIEEMKRVFETNSTIEMKGKFFDVQESIESETFKDLKMKIWHEYAYFPALFFVLLGPLIYSMLVGFYAVVLYVAFGSNPFKFSN